MKDFVEFIHYIDNVPSTREGNVFSRVCPFVHREEVGSLSHDALR